MKSLATLITLLTASAALGHDGPRVWIGNDAGVTRTYTSDDDLDPTTYTPSRIFAETMPQFFGVYTTQFPGFEVRRDGGNVPTDTLFGFDLAGPLLMLEPAQNRLRPTSKIFTSTPAPQLAVSLSTTKRITSTGIVDGFDFFSFGGVGDHSHLSFTLLGDGVSASVASPDGVYVAPLLLTSSSLARSDWFFLVFDKNGQPTQIDQAKSLANQMAIAAPGDTNFDGHVNFDDLLTLAQNYGATQGKWWADGDFDFNGNVDFDDLLTLAQRYGTNAMSSDFVADWALARSIAPEPTSLAFIGLLPRRRRR